MNRQKVVLVACGTGIATSTVVSQRVEDLIKAHGINARVIQCKIAEVAGYEEGADLLVTTTIASRNYKIPVVKAMNYLTNLNTEKVDQAILDALNG
ncbi:phosphotransferase system eiib component type 2/3 [Lucifera butyrica]|uniref:Phosphotransferase system eiib component type 2/3 n=1 Tax=Lucifera butyrica TaxID=1351585 RepID=A0A498RFS8_9FIRM|nr:PTS sugar transporter subunit IIB [Lucifera butyrica]VBB08943.1 phosphotransferase system eiib component type 2/3 [Lucifera butyrica]